MTWLQLTQTNPDWQRDGDNRSVLPNIENADFYIMIFC